MNVAFLLKEYFQGAEDVSIDVFDAHTLNDVYQQVLKTLTAHFEIEVSVLQAMSYCFYEILDNVHIHSGKPLGTAITHFDAKKERLRILVADDGMGVRDSLAENEKYHDIKEEDALKICLEDSVTDGKGMGFGLYATSRLMKDIGINFIVHSGNHKLLFKEGNTEITSPVVSAVQRLLRLFALTCPSTPKTTNIMASTALPMAHFILRDACSSFVISVQAFIYQNSFSDSDLL